MLLESKLCHRCERCPSTIQHHPKLTKSKATFNQSLVCQNSYATHIKMFSPDRQLFYTQFMTKATI